MKNMYLGIKSCVFLNETYFPCPTHHEGIGQGEVISPFLFSLFINHIEECLLYSGVNYLKYKENINGWLCLIILFMLMIW